MKTQKRKRIPLPAILIASVLVVLVGAGSIFALISNNSSNKQTDQTDSVKNDTEGKKEFIENTDNDGQSKDEDESPLNPSVSFTLTENTDSIVVQTYLTNISNGECTLTVGDFTTSAPILYQPQFSTCEGFSVSKSDIDVSDKFILDVRTDNKTFTASKRLGE